MQNEVRVFKLFLITFFGLLFCSPLVKSIAQTSIPQNSAHFHHVHLNVTNPERTLAFYEKYFGATRINYRDKSKALFTEKSFILLDSVKQKPTSNLGSSLWHIGWVRVDGSSEFKWRVQQGIEVQTPLTSLIANPSKPMDNTYYMYFWRPSRELIEVYTGSRNNRFEHVYLLVSNIEATTNWFRKQLGLTPTYKKAIIWHGLLFNVIRADNVNIILFAKPDPENLVSWPGKFKATDGSAIDHIAFSYESIEPVFEQMKSSGVEIVRNIKAGSSYGLSSFFFRGPDSILIEMVKERQVPEGIWFK